MAQCCAEPRLDELLEDSAMRLLMARDGVDEAALRRLLGRVTHARMRQVEPANQPRGIVLPRRKEHARRHA